MISFAIGDIKAAFGDIPITHETVPILTQAIESMKFHEDEEIGKYYVDHFQKNEIKPKVFSGAVVGIQARMFLVQNPQSTKDLLCCRPGIHYIHWRAKHHPIDVVWKFREGVPHQVSSSSKGNSKF